METCKICGKEDLKRIDKHVTKAHDITMEEYRTKYNSEPVSEIVEEEITEEEEIIEKPVTPKDRTKNIFKDTEKPKYSRDLDAFLNYYGVTEKEVISLIKQYKDGKPLNITQSIKQNVMSAEAKAKVMVENHTEGELVTSSLHVAEALVTKHNYKVDRVTSNPKTWVLYKQ
jgi:hypothetical protein